MVFGLTKLSIKTEICSDCVIGKHHRDSFPKEATWLASEVLQLVHADICGAVTPPSHSNKRYILCFIDDYSRKSWMFFSESEIGSILFLQVLQEDG